MDSVATFLLYPGWLGVATSLVFSDTMSLAVLGVCRVEWPPNFPYPKAGDSQYDSSETEPRAMTLSLLIY